MMVKATVRALEAVKLREQNFSYREIAEIIGYNGPGTAQAAVRNLMRRMEKETAEEYREIVTARLETQAKQIFPFTVPQKIGDVVSLNTDAIREYRLIQMELAKLHGCYLEINVHTGPNIGVQNVQQNVVVKLDLSTLNDQELELYGKLLSKAAPEPPPAHHDGNGTPEGDVSSGNGTAH